MTSILPNLNISLATMDRKENATMEISLWEQFPNMSRSREGCITVFFSQLKFLPWRNPGNIISQQGEATIRQVKNVLILFLFLIGGPANVINMAVFYKQSLKDRVNLCLFVLSLVDGIYLLSQMLIHAEKISLDLVIQQKTGAVSHVFTNNKPVVILCFSLCYISPGLSAIIATERCLCVFNPLRFHTLLRTRTMALMIIVMSVTVIGLYVIVVFRFYFACIYDPIIEASMLIAVEGELYKTHRKLIDYLDSFVFGVGLPGFVMVVVTITTLMTIVKLRQIMTWRAESSSSSISEREVALTKMLVGSSILFVVCISPIALMRLTWLFFPDINSGRRHHNFFLMGVWISEGLSCINATFNFVVYYTMGSRYREIFWALFGRRKTQPAKP